MEFLLINNQMTPFVVNSSYQRRFTKISAPIHVVVEPVVSGSDDAKQYSKALMNSLIENNQVIKETFETGLPINRFLKVEFTFKWLMPAKLGIIEVRIYNDFCDNSDSILERLREVYGRNRVSINIKNFSLHADMELVAEGLPIEVIKVGDKEVFGSTFTLSDLDSDKWYPANLRRISDGRITVSVSLDHKSVSGLYLEKFYKDQMVGRNKIMLDKAVCSDLVIAPSNGVGIKCHKSMLAVSSEVFAVMFENKMIENITNRLEVPDMTEPGVIAFLEYIYCWDLTSASECCDIALELLQAGHKYAISKLQDAMSELIAAKPIQWLDVGMAVKLFLFARNLEDKVKDKLLTKSVQVLKWYTESSSSSIMDSEEYQELFQRNPKAAMELSSLFLKFVQAPEKI